MASKHAALPDEAVELLNDWFDSHLDSPYPTVEEKELLAARSGITIKQLNAWFSNRRNRSQNTRPKRIRRQFQHELANIVLQLNSGLAENNKELIVDRLQKTLQMQSMNL